LAFEVAKRNVFNFLKAERTVLENGDAVKIISLETTFSRELSDDRLPFPVLISGNVDRVEIRNNVLRIIDYKTGKVEQNNLRINDWEGLTLDLKNEKIIQLLCYAFMLEEQQKQFPMEAGIISFKNMKAGFMPFGFKEGKEIQATITSEILEAFKTQLVDLIVEILNIEIPFEEKTV